MAPFEPENGGEHFSLAPFPSLAASRERLQGRVVIGGVLLVPGLGELTVELTGGRGLAPIVPGDGGGRNSQIQAGRMVRMMGSWVHPLTCGFAELQAPSRSAC